MKTLGLCNQKGDAGKSVVAALLAYHLAHQRRRVLAIDRTTSIIGSTGAAPQDRASTVPVATSHLHVNRSPRNNAQAARRSMGATLLLAPEHKDPQRQVSYEHYG